MNFLKEIRNVFFFKWIFEHHINLKQNAPNENIFKNFPIFPFHLKFIYPDEGLKNPKRLTLANNSNYQKKSSFKELVIFIFVHSHTIIFTSHIYIYIYIMKFWLLNSGGVVANKLDCDIAVSTFELQSRYYIHFHTNPLGKGMDPLIPPASV